MTINLDDLAEHRRKSFRAKIEHDKYGTRLIITHNGYQWTSIELNHEEMEIVKNLLISELSKGAKE